MVVEPGSLGDAAELTRKIIGCAFRVHRELGSGFLEKVYENAMVIELRKAGLAVRHDDAEYVVTSVAPESNGLPC